MSAIGIIPARYASTRFPGKPLIDINGKPMIQRVYEQALKANTLSEVIVATDDDRIKDCVELFGGKAILTSPNHPSGTDRCAEVVKALHSQHQVVVNIQGDEPFIHPEQINQLVRCFSSTEVQIATLVKKIKALEELKNTNIPKVIVNTEHKALYFSRSAIPHVRNAPENEWLSKNTFYKHIGIYAYRKDVLLKITRLQPSPLEQIEMLEQLRWLDNGYSIKIDYTEFESVAIDTPEDLHKIKNLV